MTGHLEATTTNTGDERREWAWACLVVFLLALGLRWSHQRAAQESRYQAQLGFLEDARYYASWSQEIAAGRLVGQHSFFMGPLYPYSLALIQPLAAGHAATRAGAEAQHDFSHVYRLQAIFGALSCVLLWGITLRLLGRWQAWLAALLAASQRPFIYYEGLLMPSSQALFLILAAVALLLVASRREHARYWLICGVVLGLAALAKAPSLLLLSCAALWLLLGEREVPLARRTRNLGCLLLGALPVIGLATAHNYAADGDWVLITSNAGANLWIGNGPGASGAHAGVTTRFPSAKLDFYRFGHARPADEPPASEVSRRLQRDAFEFMAAHPSRAIGLWWKKFRMFWSPVEIGTSDQFEFFKRYSPVLRLPLPGMGWIAPLGLLGLVLTLSRWRKFWPLQAVVLTQAASFTVFFVLGRYRLASVACLIVFAAAALDWGLRSMRARRLRALVGAFLGLVLFTGLVHWPIDGMGPKRGFANQHYLLARDAESRGENPMGHYRKALAGHWRAGDLSLRQRAVTHLRVADAEFASHHPQRALAQYKHAREVCQEMSPQFRYKQPMLNDIERRMLALDAD